MQGLRLSDPKERQRYSNSLNGNVVIHSPHPGRRKLICTAGGCALEVPRIRHGRVDWRWVFRSRHGRLYGESAAPGRPRPQSSPLSDVAQKGPTAARGTSPMTRLPKRVPTLSPNNRGCVKYKTATCRQSRCGSASPSPLPRSCAREWSVARAAIPHRVSANDEALLHPVENARDAFFKSAFHGYFCVVRSKSDRVT